MEVAWAYKKDGKWYNLPRAVNEKVEKAYGRNKQGATILELDGCMLVYIFYLILNFNSIFFKNYYSSFNGRCRKKLMINTESFIPEGIIRPLDHDSLFRPNV